MSKTIKEIKDEVISVASDLPYASSEQDAEEGIKEIEKLLEKLTKAERDEVTQTVETVFSIYLSVFPTPRSDEQKAMQEVIKVSVRRLKENVLEAIKTIQK